MEAAGVREEDPEDKRVRWRLTIGCRDTGMENTYFFSVSEI